MTEKKDAKVHYSVLPKEYAAGPKGLGDPDDRNMRSVEENGILPRRANKKAMELCPDEVAAFNACGKREGLKMVYKCKVENKARQACLAKWLQDPKFIEGIKEEYLKERAEFRRTGITKRQKAKLAEEAAQSSS